MTAVEYTQFRSRLDEFYAQAEDEAVVVTRSDGQDRVLISKQEYESLLEAARLHATATNEARLHKAIMEIEEETDSRSTAT